LQCWRGAGQPDKIILVFIHLKVLITPDSTLLINAVVLSDRMRRPVSTGCDTLPIIDVLKAQEKETGCEED